MDLNRLILGKSYNSTKVFRTAQHVVQAILLGVVVPALILLLIWDLTDNPNPVPGVVVIAGLVMLCFFFSYVFVVPDDLTSSATDRTLAIASKIFAYTSRGLTPEAALGASKIILSETIASAICFTDGKQVLASWGEDSAKCPAGTPVVLKTTLSVIETGEQSVFSRDTSNETGGYFPRLRAGIVAPLTVRGHCVGTLELYYPRLSSIDMRQTALASGFADLISTQLASFELERQDELTARVELRALQSQVDPHFLFNTISTIVSLVRTEPDKARSLLIDFPIITVRRFLTPIRSPRSSTRWNRALVISILCRPGMATAVCASRSTSTLRCATAWCRRLSCSRCSKTASSMRSARSSRFLFVLGLSRPMTAWRSSSKTTASE